MISTNKTTVLGIAGALNHDASVSIVQGSDIKFAGHAERYSKIKNDPLLNTELIRDALQYGTPDVIAWYENPWKKKTRQLYAGQYKTAFDMDELPKKYLQQFSELNFERTMFFSSILNRLFKKSRIINGYRVRLIEKSIKSRSNLHKGKVVKDAIEVVALK